METTAEIPIDARLIVLIETKNYCFKPGDEQYIAEMRGIYIYDKNSQTHCCELTPSYWLIHVYDEIVLSDKGDALSERERDRLRDDYELCSNDEPGKYIHCRSIDAMEAELKTLPFRYHVYGDPGVSFEDTSRDEQMEALREHYNCNHVL